MLGERSLPDGDALAMPARAHGVAQRGVAMTERGAVPLQRGKVPAR
jgi:hypothetical protein